MLSILEKIHPGIHYLLILPWLISFGVAPAAEKETIGSPKGFAVVELYTSEGCLSCPAADEVVGRINAFKANVYVLSFHVDYWNNLGWKDVFSDPAYSSRQQSYGNLFHLNSIYTPQIVVNGKEEFVGSDEGRLKEVIQKELALTPEAEIQLKIEHTISPVISVSCQVKAGPDFYLHLALVQNRTTNFVQRGENKGKTLNHYFTVRDFQSLHNPDGLHLLSLHLPAALQTSDCTVIAFLQNSKNGHIVAASGSTIP